MLGNIPGSFAEAILCSMGEPALIFDEFMTVNWANPSAEIYFGHSAEFMQGKKCSQLHSSHLECMDRCPVEKAFRSGSEQTLAVCGIRSCHKLVEAVPWKDGTGLFVVAIIHSPPENLRTRALRRDLGAALNRMATLEEASDTILDAIGVLSFVNRKGIYIKSGDGFMLLKGTGVPDSIPVQLVKDSVEGEVNHLNSQDMVLGDGAALFPVSDSVLLLAERGPWGSKSRGMLELVGLVVRECIGRLTSGASSRP